MAYTLGNMYAKNLCKRTVLLQVIIENVVTCTQCSSKSSVKFSEITAVDILHYHAK